MPNPLYNSIPNNNPMSQFVEQVKEFKRTFTGNPKEEVLKLLNSGAMTQQQFNQYSQVAQNLMGMFNQ